MLIIARVNSNNDLNYRAGSGEKIKKNFYLTGEKYIYIGYTIKVTIVKK